MKIIKILFIAAAAVSMTLTSCTKEQAGTTENGQTSGPRPLTVSFATSPTRTTLDGMQPKWSENDEILLADGINQETHTVTAAEAGKTSFEITTSLTGTITAVYPASAADISDNTINGIMVSNAPDGEFASANICMATAAATERELSFENKTAIIKVEVPEGTKKLTLTSLNPIGNSGHRASSGAVAIASESATTITVGTGNSTIPNPCYLSILAPAFGAVLLQDLNVDVDDKAQGGFSPSSIDAKGKTPSTYSVEANTIYTLSKESLHEYVTVDGMKWATMNVGATASDPYGEYFMWGETSGQKPSSSTFDPGFSWTIYHDRLPKLTSAVYAEDAPKVFKKYVLANVSKYGYEGYSDVKSILDLEDDAAFWNWGGAWRMPTTDEFETFKLGYSYIRALGFDFTYQGITFPVAGYGDGTQLCDAGVRGRYWLSSVDYFNVRCGRFITIEEGGSSAGGDVVGTSITSRYYGYPVRPVSGPLAYNPDSLDMGLHPFQEF